MRGCVPLRYRILLGNNIQQEQDTVNAMYLGTVNVSRILPQIGILSYTNKNSAPVSWGVAEISSFHLNIK